MALFNRFVRGLQQVFPSSGPDKHQIAELHSSVTPVYPYPPRSGALERVRVGQFVSTTGLTPSTVIGWNDPNSYDAFLLSSAAGIPIFRNPNLWAEILYGDISHTSGVSQILQLALSSPELVNLFVARWGPMNSALTGGVPSGFEPLFGDKTFAPPGPAGIAGVIETPPWPLVMPPGFTIQPFAGTAAVAYSFELDFAYVIHPIAEEGFRS